MSRTNFDELLEAGCHFGHLKRKWNPAMAPYIFMERNGIHIIDLHKTVVKVDEAAAALKQIAKSGKKILFVATKKQAKSIVAEKAEAGRTKKIVLRGKRGMITDADSDLTRLPSALLVVDVMKEHIAVKEANRLGIPVFGLVDTNSNPANIDYVIPANDDATKSIDVILTALDSAIQEGLDERKAEKQAEEADKSNEEGEAKPRRGAKAARKANEETKAE